VPNPLYSRAQLELAFAALSDRLVERGVDASVVLFGDAAMMFGFDARESIDHVDAAPTPRGLVLGAARDAAKPLGLPAHWINDQSTAVLGTGYADDVDPLWTAPNLAVASVSADQMLAMRALAPNRPEDLEDIRLLAANLGIVDLIDIEVLIAEIHPGRTLNAKTRAVLDPLF
jgi:nucleotide-binding universal stress UspA family protein